MEEDVIAVGSRVCASMYGSLLLAKRCRMFLAWLVVGWLLGYILMSGYKLHPVMQVYVLEHSCLYFCVVLGPAQYTIFPNSVRPNTHRCICVSSEIDYYVTYI